MKKMVNDITEFGDRVEGGMGKAIVRA